MERALTLFGVAIVIIVVVGLLLILPVMLLWNACLVPAVSGLSEIEWLQAWGIMILCGLLFKSSFPTNKD
jgi:hypothetical protein